jgi:predicted nucleic acid-binding Zn ribbon protein
MSKFFCKHCGIATPSVQSLVNNPCTKSPSRKHVLYEGGEKSRYTCKHCGISTPTLVSLVNNPCVKSPSKKHEPAL